MCVSVFVCSRGSKSLSVCLSVYEPGGGGVCLLVCLFEPGGGVCVCACVRVGALAID